jgi:hypothetical protein
MRHLVGPSILRCPPVNADLRAGDPRARLARQQHGDGGLLVNEVVEVNVSESGELHTTGVFRSKNGPSGIEFAASGHVPSLFTTLSEAGETFDGSIFNA